MSKQETGNEIQLRPRNQRQASRRTSIFGRHIANSQFEPIFQSCEDFSSHLVESDDDESDEEEDSDDSPTQKVDRVVSFHAQNSTLDLINETTAVENFHSSNLEIFEEQSNELVVGKLKKSHTMIFSTNKQHANLFTDPDKGMNAPPSEGTSRLMTRSLSTNKIPDELTMLEHLRENYDRRGSNEKGISDSSFTDIKLLQRESIRFSSTVQKLIRKIWKATKQRVKSYSICQEEYISLSVRLYRALVGKLNKDEAHSVAKEDWEVDSCGKEFITYEGFTLAFFQLCDVWTNSISQSEYIEFFESLIKQIIDPETGKLKDVRSIFTRRRMEVLSKKKVQSTVSNREEICSLMNLLKPEGYWEMDESISKIIKVDCSLKFNNISTTQLVLSYINRRKQDIFEKGMRHHQRRPSNIWYQQFQKASMWLKSKSRHRISGKELSHDVQTTDRLQKKKNHETIVSLSKKLKVAPKKFYDLFGDQWHEASILDKENILLALSNLNHKELADSFSVMQSLEGENMKVFLNQLFKISDTNPDAVQALFSSVCRSQVLVKRVEKQFSTAEKKSDNDSLFALSLLPIEEVENMLNCVTDDAVAEKAKFIYPSNIQMAESLCNFITKMNLEKKKEFVEVLQQPDLNTNLDVRRSSPDKFRDLPEDTLVSDFLKSKAEIDMLAFNQSTELSANESSHIGRSSATIKDCVAKDEVEERYYPNYFLPFAPKDRFFSTDYKKKKEKKISQLGPGNASDKKLTLLKDLMNEIAESKNDQHVLSALPSRGSMTMAKNNFEECINDETVLVQRKSLEKLPSPLSNFQALTFPSPSKRQQYALPGLSPVKRKHIYEISSAEKYHFIKP